MDTDQVEIHPLSGQTTESLHEHSLKVLPIYEAARSLIDMRGWGQGAWCFNKRPFRRPVIDGSKVTAEKWDYSVPGAITAVIRRDVAEADHPFMFNLAMQQMVSPMLLSPLTPPQLIESMTMAERLQVAQQLIAVPDGPAMSLRQFNDYNLHSKKHAMDLLQCAIDMHTAAVRQLKAKAN